MKLESLPSERGYQIQGHLPGYEITLVNPGDRYWTKHKYVFSFGAYNNTKLMVWANGLNSGFDEAVDWLVDHAPGLLADEQVEEAYREALAEHREGCDCKSDYEACDACNEAARTDAEADATCGGNYGNYVLSYEWTFVEDPSREQLKDMLRI